MSLWEYKVITSGKGGFASPALMEKFLNELGREEWEIIHFQTQPDNLLAFTGLARRTTQRDWSLQDAAAAAAAAEAEKLRAEFAAKFQAATAAPAAEEKSASFLDEKVAPDDGFRKPIDTSRDDDPEAEDDKGDEEKDEWDQLNAEDELPSFFDALKPHMRRNQRGPGMSVGVDYLAKKWGLAEEDIKGALVECGLQIPADENAKPVYIEYDGDLFWVNINRRGELWINTREKPRPVFRIVQGTRVEGDTGTENGGRRTEAEAPKPAEAAGESSGGRAPKPETPPEPLPAGPALLEKVRPHMRRNRRGPGGSGSASFLSRALRCSEAELTAGFQALGLVVPGKADDKPVFVEVGAELWWLNLDSRGGLWINGRDKDSGDAAAPAAPGATAASPATAPASAELAPAAATAPAPEAGAVLAAVRLLLKETKTGAVAGRADRLAEELGKPAEEFVATLVGAGLKVPEKSREKPVFVEHAGEIFWLNKNAKDELWLNAKASKYADQGDGEKKPARRGRKKEEG
ncbi:MAG: hypothetical protein JSR48_06420 [Verrucomicrobia bacterium]|nr:hypothetical protein [Verrucomicrobiota bacterium]